jgi:hypothetical protein
LREPTYAWSNSAVGFTNVYVHAANSAPSIEGGDYNLFPFKADEVRFWDEAGDGDWMSAPRWRTAGNDESDVSPNSGIDAVVETDTVELSQNQSVRDLILFGGGVHVDDSLTLEYYGGATFLVGSTLRLDLGATLRGPADEEDSDWPIRFDSDAELIIELGQVGGAIEVVNDGTASLAGTLTLKAVDFLVESRSGWGTLPLGLISTEDPSGVEGAFATVPEFGDHLGLDVFFDSLAQEDDSLEATLFLPAPGDADGNRDVNGFDIQDILSANKFGKPIPAIWTEGDFTGDGFVNGFDIQEILSANLFGKGPYTVGPLEGLLSPPGSPALASAGTPGAPLAPPPVAELIVTPDGVTLDTNGLTINGYVIVSALGVFTGDDADNLGYFMEDTDALVTGNMGFTLNGTYALGDVIGSEHSGVDPTEDLTFTYTINGQAGVYTGVITIGGGEMASGGGGFTWLREFDPSSLSETGTRDNVPTAAVVDALMAWLGQ